MSGPIFPPRLTTDCHTHLVGDRSVYPMVSPRSYTPSVVSPDDMLAMMHRVGLGRIVIVQISVFGADNTCLMDGLEKLGDRARGVVQVSEAISNAALDEMHRAGVRGIRVNLNTLGVTDPAEAGRRLGIAADKCARNGWHLQIFSSPPVLVSLGEQLQALPVPVVIDHFGLLPVLARGGEAETLILNLMSSGKAWVKISGAYRLDHPEARKQIAALAVDLYKENPENVVWGSDWPHPPQHSNTPEPDPAPQPYRAINPIETLTLVRTWFDDLKDRERILVDNPARLYDFPLVMSDGI